MIVARTHLQLKKVDNGRFNDPVLDGQRKKTQEPQADHEHLGGGRRDRYDAGEDLRQPSTAVTEFLD